MKLETHGQIAHLLKALERDFYHPLGEIDFCGFVTKDLLSIDKAQSLDKKPMPKGYNWGSPKNTGFFDFICRIAQKERIAQTKHRLGKHCLFKRQTLWHS